MLGRTHDTRLRKDRIGASPVTVGILVLLAIVVGTYFGFSKHVPFTHGFRLKAVFPSANSIRVNSPVRIAGVTVGKVKGVEKYDGGDGTAALVTMEIDKKGLPIHKDATVKIRPRIFLEGNFFVDLKPGTPSAPTIQDGDTLPITQASDPVQLDQVLTTLQSDTRDELRQLLDGYGTGLQAQPTAADDRGQDPSVQGKTGAQALNQAYQFAGPAFKGLSIVNDAFLGTEPHDLSGLIAGLGKVSAALDTHEQQLKDLVTNLDVTMAAFASEQQNLSAAIHELGPTIQTAKATLTHLNSSFPATRAFAKEILPGVKATPSTIKAAFPWLAQTRKLLAPAELRGVAQELSPATRDLAAVTDSTVQLLPQADLVAKCATDVILPTGDVKIDDGPLSTGVENYKEFWYAMVGLAGEGQNFDGNGQYVRFQTGGGDQTLSFGKAGVNAGQLFGNTSTKPLGTRPAYTGKRPPYNPDFPCYKNPLPDVNGAATGPPDGSRSSAPASSVTTRSAARSTSGQARLFARRDSVAAQLVSRLNPFRKAGERP